MAISFTDFTNAARLAANDDQKITKTDANLRFGTNLSCFNFISRCTENRATSRAFVESIRNHPEYRSYLPEVENITRGLEGSFKPLTARTIRAVTASIDQVIAERRFDNRVASDALHGRVIVPPQATFILQHHCDDKNIDLARMNPFKAFSMPEVRNALRSECPAFLGQMMHPTFMAFRQTPFIENALQELLQDVFEGVDTPTMEDLPPNLFVALAAKLEPHREIMDLLGRDCAALNNQDMQKAVDFLAKNRERQLIADEDVKAVIHHMTHLDTSVGIKLPEANLATKAGCEKALISAIANTAMGTTMAQTLAEHGLPEHLATSLALHPTVLANATTALAELDFASDTLRADMTQILQDTAEAFVAENHAELTRIVEQFTAQDMALETQTSIINTVLGAGAFMGSVLGPNAELAPEIFAERLKSFTQNALSLSSGAHGAPLNAEAMKATLQHTMNFYLAQTGVPKAEAFRRIHDQYTPLMQNMAAIMRERNTIIPTADHFHGNIAMKQEFTAQYNVLHMLAEATQPHASGSPEADTIAVFDGKTQNQIFQGFTDDIVNPEEGQPNRVPVGNKQLDSLTIAVGQNFSTGQYDMAPELFGSKVHHNHESYRAVMQQYFDGMADDGMISANPTAPAAPNALLTAFINEHKADCGLADRDGLTVASDKVSMDTLFKAARTAYNDYVRESKGIVTTAAGTHVVEQAMVNALNAMGQSMTEISQSSYIAKEDKQAMLDMALATKLRTAAAIDCAYTVGLRRTVIEQESLADKFIALAKSPLALNETIVPFIFETLGPSLSDMPTMLRDIDGFGKGVGLEELATGLGHIIANSDAISDEQRSALFEALDAEATRHTVGGLCSGMNNQLFGLAHSVTDAEARGRMIDKCTNNTKILACITALRDALATRLAKDNHTDMPKAQPEAYAVSSVRIPKAQCSGDVLRACTYRLGNEASLVLTPLDYALADKKPRPSEDVFTAAEKVLGRMRGSFNDDFMHSLIAHHADKLATAVGHSDGSDKELSSREIYTLLTGKKAPYFLSENDMAAKIQEAVLDDFRPAVLVLAPHTAHDDILHIDMVTAALKKGLSAQTLNDVLQGKRLTLDSVAPQALTMHGLENYNQSNAYGLMTEHAQKHPESRITFTDVHGNGKALVGHRTVSGDVGEANHTLYRSIMAKANELAQTPKQAAVIMQSIGFASTRIFAELGQTLAANVQEDGKFTHTLQQNADNSVDVIITMPTQDVFHGSLTLNIDQDSNVRATAFDFGLDLEARTRMEHYNHIR